MNMEISVVIKQARLVALGYTQQEFIDYDFTYCPVLQMRSLRLIIAYCAIHSLRLHKFDVTTAFLNAPLDKEIYMEQPDGFTDGTKRVWKLNNVWRNYDSIERILRMS